MMNMTDNTTELRPVALAFTKCFDATTHGRIVHVTADEETQLRRLLASLRDYGLLLSADFAPARPCCGFQDAVALLRACVGTPFVDAALAAAGRPLPPPPPEPTALALVWPFEPEGSDASVLVSSAQLWGTDLLVEALLVQDDDNPAPVEAVRDRYERWTGAAGIAGRLVRATHLPGRSGSYAVFAAAAPV